MASLIRRDIIVGSENDFTMAKSDASAPLKSGMKPARTFGDISNRDGRELNQVSEKANFKIPLKSESKPIVTEKKEYESVFDGPDVWPEVSETDDYMNELPPSLRLKTEDLDAFVETLAGLRPRCPITPYEDGGNSPSRDRKAELEEPLINPEKIIEFTPFDDDDFSVLEMPPSFW